MHAKIWTSQMLYLQSLLHKARFPSSEEEKSVDGKLQGCMHLPSRVGMGTETNGTKTKRKCWKKDRQQPLRKGNNCRFT